MSLRLTTKVFGVFLASVFAGGVISAIVVGVRFRSYALSTLQKRLEADAQTMAAGLSGATCDPLLKRLASPDQPAGLWGALRSEDLGGASPAAVELDPMTPVLILDSTESAEYAHVKEAITQVHHEHGLGDWVGLNVVRGKTVFVAGMEQEPFRVIGPSSDPDGIQALLSLTAHDGRVRSTDCFWSLRGWWVSAFAPVRGSDGTIRGVAEASNGADGLVEVRRTEVIVLLLDALITLLFGGLISMVALGPFSRRLRLIQGTVDSIREGGTGAELPTTPADELGALSDALNGMTRSLAENERMRGILVQTMSRGVAEEMLSGKPELSGAEHEATVLFADIRGFTSLSEELAAREVITMLNDYFDCTAPPVELHGGVVDKFLGDGMLAIFGAPTRLNDDALSAVMAALAMKEALAQVNSQRLATGSPPLNAGIGINTGPVVTGTVGSQSRLNYTVLGQAVNIASRLCSHAAAGQIVISQATWLRVKSRVEGRELPPADLKGVTGKVPVFEVTALKRGTLG